MLRRNDLVANWSWRRRDEASPPLYEPLAVGAPRPLREPPVKVERMIHFVPPHVEKVRAKAGELAAQVDVVLGNLEDAVPIEAKEAARAGFIAMAQAHDFGATGLWTRVNALNSPWMLDDVTQIIAAIGDKLDVVMVPKVEGPWDIHFISTSSSPSLRRATRRGKPILIHAILETAEGVKNVDAIAAASPRMHGHESRAGRPRGLARDEDDARRRRPSRLQGCRRTRRAMRPAPPSSRTSGITPSPKWSTPAPPTA